MPNLSSGPQGHRTPRKPRAWAGGVDVPQPPPDVVPSPPPVPYPPSTPPEIIEPPLTEPRPPIRDPIVPEAAGPRGLRTPMRC